MERSEATRRSAARKRGAFVVVLTISYLLSPIYLLLIPNPIRMALGIPSGYHPPSHPDGIPWFLKTRAA